MFVSEFSSDMIISPKILKDNISINPIAEVLGKIGGRAAKQFLEITEGDIEWNLRFFAIIALADMGNEKGIDLLIYGMNDHFFLIRYTSLKILRRMIVKKKIP